MKKLYSLVLLCILLTGQLANAQTTIVCTHATSLTYYAATGGVLCFGVKNNNAFPIAITQLDNYMPATTSTTFTLWYHPTAAAAAPPPDVTTANGWIQVPVSSAITSTTAGVVPIFTGMYLVLPAGATYRLALVASANGPYYNGTNSSNGVGTTFSSGGVDVLTQENPLSPSYSGAFPGFASANSPRGFYGNITFVQVQACSGPPNAGSATASNVTPCNGDQVTLNLTGATIATGLTYKWQSSTSATGPFTDITGTLTSSLYNFTPTGSFYYRCAVTCSGNTEYSLPIQVTVPSLFPGGTYTINSAVPTSGSNFTSFGDAVNAVKCGISGPVTFNVAPGSGPYNEQITIPHISTTSATNKIIFNGNDVELNHNGSVSAATIALDGADYITFNRLNIVASGTSGAYGVYMTNNADNNTINSCKIDVGLANTGTGNVGVGIGNTLASSTAAGTANCDNNTINNCEIYGGYSGVSLIGSSSSQETNNKVTNNIIHDQYVYRVYCIYQTGVLIDNNDMYNSTARASHSTFYGPLLTTGCDGGVVNGNKIHDNFPNALTSTSISYVLYCAANAATQNIFSNNIVYNMYGNGTQYLIYNSGGQNTKYYFNTIVSDYAAATAGTTYGYYQSGSHTNCQFDNNLIFIKRGGTGTKYCVYFATSGGRYAGNRNDLYMGSATSNGIGYYNATPQTTLAGWKGAIAPHDANTVSLDPVFLSPATGAFVPTAAALNNLGAPITGITKDILGITRNATTPDIGVVEFPIAAACNTPTGLTATAITSTSANLGWTAVSGVLGYEYIITTNARPYPFGTFIGTNTLNPTTLAPGQTYYLHVRSKCGDNYYSAWATKSFITPCNAPSANPAISAITYTGATINWNAAANAYEYAITTSSTPPASGTAIGTNSYVATGLNQGTTYYVHVRSKCGAASFSSWVTASFTTTTCNTPVPASSGITYTTATVSWPTISGAMGYEYAWDENATPPASGTSTNTTSQSHNGLTGGTTYYAHVRTQCSAGVYSAWATLAVNIPNPPCDAPLTTNVSNITANSANINWSTVAGSIGYQYAVSTDPNAPVSGTATLNNSISPSGLTQGTVYYIHVRNRCSANVYSIWSTTSFTTICPASPSVNINNIGFTTADISWPAVTGVTDYEYAVSLSNIPPASGTSTNTTSQSISGLLPSNAYYVYVRSKCTGGVYSSWTVASFNTLNCDPVNPNISNISFTSANISWTPASSTDFEIFVSPVDNPPLQGTPISTSSYTASNLTSNTTYYVHIRSSCGTGVFSTWTTVPFTTLGCGQPVNGAISSVTQTGATIKWEAGSNANSYEYAVTLNGAPPINPTATTDNSFSTGSLSHSTTYNAHIRSICDGGNQKSNWTVLAFRTSDIPTSINNVSDEIELTAYPNPVHDQLIVKLEGHTAMKGSINLIDMTGRKIVSVNVHNSETYIDMTKIAPGVYMLKYDDGVHAKTLRVTKQ